jgi:ABC-type phosphate/phosphonate transport system substrate-binding protein
MALLNVRSQHPRLEFVLLAGTLTTLLAAGGAVIQGQQPKQDVLRIGMSGPMTTEALDKKKAEADLDMLRAFIKEEAGFNNEIVQLKDWRELVDKMVKGQMQLGVFEGYEFAWAQEKTPALKPLALAINVDVYPVAYVVVKKDYPAKDFAGLKGQTLALPGTSQGFLHLFLAKQTQASGKSLETFFSKITTSEKVEDALDDVVDGVLQAVAVERAALEVFKRSKPARFKQLKPVAHSQPFPPVLVAYYDNTVDHATLKLLQAGLLSAHKKERGQTLLTLSGLTRFENVPADFGKIIAQTQKNYPPPGVKPE